MEEQMSAESRNPYDQMKYALPNATAVLILGIISIPGCCCFYGLLGLASSIIALVLAGKDMKRYDASPESYTSSSLSNLKAGRICGIIGLIFSALCLIFILVIVATVGVDALRHPDQWMEHYKNSGSIY